MCFATELPGPLGESFNLPPSNSSELENPFVLSSTACPWHSTRWIKHGLVQPLNQLLPWSQICFPGEKYLAPDVEGERVAKPGVGLGVLTPECCLACLDSFPGIGMNGQRHTRVFGDAGFVSSCLPPPRLASSGDSVSRGWQPGWDRRLAQSPWGSGKPGAVLPCCVHHFSPALAACPPSPRDCSAHCWPLKLSWDPPSAVWGWPR